MPRFEPPPTPRPPRRIATFCWLLGLTGAPFAFLCLYARIEPFYTSIYSFFWWPYIFVADFAVHRLRGRSMLSDRPREFLLLALWSTPVWLIFEAMNLRLENWHYVQTPFPLSGAGFFMMFAFATVLPGLFETAELILGAIERLAPQGGIPDRPVRVRAAHVWIQTAVGAAMLALPLIRPETFFALTWGWAFFLLDPLCRRFGGRSILGQLERGDATRLVALLGAGFICGGLWEGWNAGAHSKWIYTVPVFDEWKLGEMPVLGFLGFPPFTLECYAIVNCVNLLRGGRSWELPSEENAARPGMPRRLAAVLWIAVVLCAVPVFIGVFQHTVSSYARSADAWFAGEIGEQGVEALRRAGATRPYELGRLEERPQEIPPATFQRIRAVAALSEWKGMGLPAAEALYEYGIRSLKDLAETDPQVLSARLRERFGGGAQPSPARVKVWTHAAEQRLASR